MKKYISLLAIILSPFLMAQSCRSDKQQKDNCEGVICTMVFTMINVTVQNSDGSPAKLDEVYTIRESTGQKLTFQQNSEEYYTVLDDSYRKELQNQTDKFRFVGMKNGQKVVEEIYTINAGCCHVNKISGKPTITLSNP